MLRFGLPLALALLVAASLASGAESFPYTARVTSDDASLRSGPGKNYYSTDKLKSGDSVEVYRHDPGGWCAVKPTERSFSWVEAADLEEMGDGIARVRSAEAIARVGSYLSESREVSQVRLHRDETVEIIEKSADGHWFKITPPAGEFRWVFEKFLEAKAGPTVEPDAVPVAKSEAAPDAKLDDAAQHDASPKAGGEQTASLSANHEPGAKADVKLTSHGGERWQMSPVAVEGSPASATGAGSDSAASTNREIVDLDLALSTVVSKDISQWAFTPLRDRAQVALGNAKSAIDRGRVRTLISKIDRFEDIKRRSDALGPRLLASLPASSASAARALPAPSQSNYDAFGRLMPSADQRAGSPQYVLVDEKGNYSTLISAGPGVDLIPYLNKQIAVQGVRTYLPEARKQHVSVQRVAEMPDLSGRVAGRRRGLLR